MGSCTNNLLTIVLKNIIDTIIYLNSISYITINMVEQ
jgi:hypothetical protein